jgi:hypothetical protein
MNKFVIHSGNNSRLLVKPLLEARGNWVEASEQEAEAFKAQFIWKPTVYHVRVRSNKAYNQMDELFTQGFGIMIHNHLENNREITTKTGLIRSLRNFYQTNELAIKATYQVHDTIPTSFIITAQVEDEEFRLLTTRFNEIQNGFYYKEKLPAKHCSKNMWLLKPAALNQGRGIEVCRSVKEINTILKSKLPHSLWLVQKYIERPLLFKGRKFDIRVWAFATAKHDLFYYKHGYLRTSSSEYDPHASDNYIHLTNNCLQKFGDNYGAFEKGNTLPFQAFQEYLDQYFPQFNINFWTMILPRIKDLIIDSYLSGKRQMLKGKRNRVFELFGYDFLIDEDFRVWLIEVNTNPYLGIPNEYIEGLLPVMLDDLLALVLDTHIPPKIPRSRKENDFDLLYCEVASQYSPDGTSKNFRQAYSTSLYPIDSLSQGPLSKHKPEEEPHSTSELRPIVRDLLQIVKEDLDLTLTRDPSDFSVLCSRVMSQLNNWELMSEEQISNGLQALKLLCSGLAAGTFVIFGHLPDIFNLCISEDVPCSVQLGAVEAVTLGCHDLKFRKEIVKLGICSSLIQSALDPDSENGLKNAAFKAIIALSSNLGKKVYIPGETREYNWVRCKIINEGIPLALLKLGQASDVDVSLKVKNLLQNEFALGDWEIMINVLNKVLESESPGKNHRAQSFRVSTESYVSILVKEMEPKIPKVLNDKQFLNEAKNQITSFCEMKREEIKAKVEREKQKKMENEEIRCRQQEIIDRESEEKRLRVEEYMKKRYDEIKRQKLEEIKRQKDSRVSDDKFDNMRKQLIIEKCKKTEEIKRIQRAKLKKQEENLRKIEEEKKRDIEEKRKKALEDWLKMKMDREKEKRLQEKIKRDEEQQRREIEFQQRKEEILQKIEEKKKVKKTKEEKKEKIRRVEGLLAEETSRTLLEQEDMSRNMIVGNIVIPSRASPMLRDWRLKKKKILDKKKKILNSAPNQFLFEVYANQKS